VSALSWLWEALTGSAYTTGRSAVADYGPTPATRYPELARYRTAELMARPRAEVLAEIERSRVMILPLEHSRPADDNRRRHSGRAA
jgi:hypothetical protein